MTYDGLVTKKNNKRYIARVILLPEITVTGETEETVLEKVRTAITDLRASSHIVRLDVPALDEPVGDPWVKYAGMWADDPDWDVFQAEIEAFRQTMDAQTATKSA